MTLIIVLALIAIAAIVATVHALSTDGYHRLPTRAEAVHSNR